MITEAILSMFFGLADLLLGLLPPIEWTIETNALQYIGDILSMIAYLLPMSTIKTVIALIVAISTFRVAVAVIRMIKGFIPTFSY